MSRGSSRLVLTSGAIRGPQRRVEGEGLREFGGIWVEGCGFRAEGGEHRAFSSQVTGQRPASLYIIPDRHGDTAWSPYLQSPGMFNCSF